MSFPVCSFIMTVLSFKIFIKPALKSLSDNFNIWIFGIDLYRLLFASNMNHTFFYFLLLVSFGHTVVIMNHKVKEAWIMLFPLNNVDFFYGWQINHWWIFWFLLGLDLFLIKVLFIFNFKFHSRTCPHSRPWSLCLRNHLWEVPTEEAGSLQFEWIRIPINSSALHPLVLLSSSQPWKDHLC